jgi:hypothetical protein
MEKREFQKRIELVGKRVDLGAQLYTSGEVQYYTLGTCKSGGTIILSRAEYCELQALIRELDSALQENES